MTLLILSQSSFAYGLGHVRVCVCVPEGLATAHIRQMHTPTIEATLVQNMIAVKLPDDGSF